MLRVSVVARAAAFAAGLAIAACGAAAADDYRVEAYKDTVAKTVGVWSDKVASVGTN